MKDSRHEAMTGGRGLARQAWILALLMALASSCHFHRISISVVGTERLMREFSFSETSLGAIYSSYLLVYTILMTPGGWLIDRFGPTVMLAAMGLGSAALVAASGLPGLAGASTAATFAMFLVLRSMLGMVSVPTHPGAARAVSLWFSPRARAWANSAVTAACLVGIALTYPVFGSLMDRVGWPSAFAWCGIATGLIALLWMTTASDGPRQPLAMSDNELPPYDSSGHHARTNYLSLALLTASYAAVGYFQYLFFYWIEYYFTKILELGEEQSRRLAMIPMLAMAAGMFVGGAAASLLQFRLGRWRALCAVPIFGMIVGALFAFAGAAATDRDWVVACFALAMAGVGLAEGPFWTVAIELGGRRGGTSAAIFNTGGNAGGVLAPLVTPLFSGYFGWQAGIALAAGFCLLGGVLWFWVRPPEPANPSRGHDVE